MTEYNDRIRQIKVTDENDRSKRLEKRQMKMTDGNDRSIYIYIYIKKCRYTFLHIRSMESLIYAAGEPLSLIYPAAGEPVSLIYPAAGEPVSRNPAAGEPVSLTHVLPRSCQKISRAKHDCDFRMPNEDDKRK